MYNIQFCNRLYLSITFQTLTHNTSSITDRSTVQNMGGCCQSAADRQANQYLAAHSREENEKLQWRKFRVLLLGISGSGKSTLFKQIQRIGSPDETFPFTTVDRLETKRSIQWGMVVSMLQLLYESQVFYQKDATKYRQAILMNME